MMAKQHVFSHSDGVHGSSFSIFPYTFPLQETYHWSHGDHTDRSGLLMRVVVDGHVGWGEAAPSPDANVDLDDYAQAALELIRDLDPRHDEIDAAMDDRNAENRIRTGLVTAWLSARADRDGKSLGAILGENSGLEPAAHVPLNALVTEFEPEVVAETCLNAYREGISTFKVKCFPDFGRDLARLTAIRAAVPAATLRLDPNGSWRDRHEAIARIELLAGNFDIEYIEQPLPVSAPLAEMAELTRVSPIPIALDQSVDGLAAVEDILSSQAASVLILKAPHLGGPDRAVSAILRAHGASVKCTVTASLETSVGIHTALHCASLLPPPVPPCGLDTSKFFAVDADHPPARIAGRLAVPHHGSGAAPKVLEGDKE